MTKKHGLMDVLASAGLVETDVPSVPHAVDVTTLPQTIYQPATQTTFINPAPALNSDDQARLKALEAQVYATPSSYVIFQRVRESLGNTSDMAMVFRVLSAANPGVTPQKVMADIDIHLGIISQKQGEFDRASASAKATQDKSREEIAQLTQQIATATARITQLQQSVSDTDHSIADGTARFKAVTDQLSAPLVQTKQLLSTTV